MTESKKHAGGRKRTGSLSWRASGWRAFIRITENGKTVRKFVDLETTNKSIARRKLERLVGKAAAGELPPETIAVEAPRYTVDDLAERHYATRSNGRKNTS